MNVGDSWIQEHQFSSVQLLSRVWLFVTPWITACQASLSITPTTTSSVVPLLLLPPIPPSIRVFSNESTLRMRWPKYWRFSFSIIASKEIPRQPQNTKITLNLITCLVQKGNNSSWILVVLFIPNQNYNVYILCFVSISPRVHKDQEVNQAPLSVGFSRREYWSGLPFPSPRDLPDPGIEPGSPALQANSLLTEPPGKTHQSKEENK